MLCILLVFAFIHHVKATSPPGNCWKEQEWNDVHNGFENAVRAHGSHTHLNYICLPEDVEEIPEHKFQVSFYLGDDIDIAKEAEESLKEVLNDGKTEVANVMSVFCEYYAPGLLQEQKGYEDRDAIICYFE